ncbi:oxidoreductase [Brasilonema octagenarum UFV-E1]|uniref:Oxidoreductase n=2 Tax=Brasilonema TaxID=383614 RepID=A0A856MG12_9CYAN|nr:MULTISPECIES: SDR family oxidoreductase [Brasilonema]NMF62297.1 oxidoreductase [Brasilonema octagenarum UFV-OR1]QDL10285.1 oxidoreductase [Brasilonema sennae CENA114]QDL16635.1 oxidoreductase [Brasilonema octagenarum UFV-E1]
MIDYGLSGKVALVTGVSRHMGIGAAIARSLAASGANVFITYYRPYDKLMPWGSKLTEAEEIVESLKLHLVKAAGLEANLAEPLVPKNLFDFVEETLGHVDILVNNAVHDQQADIHSLTAELLDVHYAVNVRGTTLLCAEFAKRHDGRPGGRIINLTSGQSLAPMPENLPYAITKGAVEALTLSLSASLASKGITVNAVDPGPTDTGWMSNEIRSMLESKAPFGRVSTPEDAARIVLFLASSQGQWITGQIIRSRGGQ